MSKTSLPLGVKLALVARAGGRCQYRGCNERIDTDFLTGRRANAGAFAHIVADEPGGPRGDPVRSAQLATSIDNLMLLCLRCHRRIDVEDVPGHPEPLLLEFKRDHEDRVERVLAIDGALRTRLLLFTAPVGERPVTIDLNDVQRAILPAYQQGRPEVIDLACLHVRDHEPIYWERMADEVVRQTRNVLRAGPGESPLPWSVFALAPIPLLMVLGREIGDIAPSSVFQKHRVPDTWCWQPGRGPGDGFIVSSPIHPVRGSNAALVLSISGQVLRPAVESVVGLEVPTWEIAASSPSVGFVRTAGQLAEFGLLFRQVLADIRDLLGDGVHVHVFPAVPNSVAVECGRRLLPKADPALTVYDFNRTVNGFIRAVEMLPVRPQ